MAKLIIDNITMNQAKVLADWYEGRGEQDAQCWFDENGNGEDSPTVDVSNKKCKSIDKKNETVTLLCK